MSKPFIDLNEPAPAAGATSFGQPPHLPGAPPPSPNGRVVHDNLGFSINKDGIWHYHGSPIQRKELVCLFASTLSRDSDGRYWLVTPAEMGPIDVEDAPLLAVELFVAGVGEEQTISLRTNVDEIVGIDERHPLHVERNLETGEAVPYLRLDKRLEARLTRAVYYDLVARAVEVDLDGRPGLGIWSSGCMFPLGWLDDIA
jgi:uncharacterized protein